MLQRAASNAYSWWMASHIRTKQSKWLEQSLQDMGDKVEVVLKLIEEDGDSFAKRAEMYYKKRPELISFVEESYRAYRSLAERYDHISKELQNANSTLASAFPDQFQFPIDDDDDYETPKVRKNRFSDKSHNANIPKAPAKFPAKNIKAYMALTKAPKNAKNEKNTPKSGLTKSEALNEIDKLQKRILTLQTEKEFAKSSYESGYAKYWQIEEDITGMQEKVSKLEDEFKIAKVIEDDEARSLMAEAALKSCQDTLAQLEEKQRNVVAEANAERHKIKDAREKLKSLKGEVLGSEGNTDDASGNVLIEEENRPSFGDTGEGVKESEDLEMLREKIKEHFDVGETASLTVSQMAEKIDELVNKVISLESSVSSQTALIHSLRSETDELQSQIKNLEDDKARLLDRKNSLSDKVKEMEDKLKGIQDLDNKFENQNFSLKTHFTEARSNIETISEKLQDEKSEGEQESSTQQEKRSLTGSTDMKIEVEHDMEKDGSSVSTLPQDVEKEDEPAPSVSNDSGSSKSDEKQLHPPEEGNQSILDIAREKEHSKTTDEVNIAETIEAKPATMARDDQQVPAADVQQKPSESEARELSGPSSAQSYQEDTRKDEGEPDWQKLFENGLEDKQKVILAEYTSTLRNYKEAKKKITEIVTKSQDDFARITTQVEELRRSNAIKDEEIQLLRQKLLALQRRFEEFKNSTAVNDTEQLTKFGELSFSAEEDDGIRLTVADEEREVSHVEEKLRADIDEILEENLDFWMRFSSSFAQVQKFQSAVQDLHEELAKIEKNKEKKEGSSHGSAHGSSHGSAHGSSHGGHVMNAALQSEVRPIYRHLREIHTELTVWLEQSEKLKDELQRRLSQLCNIQDEIQHALSAGAEDEDMKFTSYQAAKFHGEVANMQQENDKVADELQAGMDHITNLHLEVEHTMTRLNKELGFSGSKSQNENEMRSASRGRVPLRSFIFGVTPQKKKRSIFSCMHPAMMQRRYQQLKPDKSS